MPRISCAADLQTVKRISPNAIDALKEALIDSFWRKRDLLDYLRAEVEDERLLQGIDWLNPGVYKRESVRRFIDRLVSGQELHRDLLLRLMVDVAAMDDFPHLAWLEDAPEKIARAKQSVGRLRRHIDPHEQQLAEQAMDRERIESERARVDVQRAVSEALGQIAG